MEDTPSSSGAASGSDSRSGRGADWEQFFLNYRRADYLPEYEIGNRLGGGVYGEVFKARKTSIGKAYAIKFLKIDDDAEREQILNELENVQLFAQVDHPNLVSIEDRGIVDGIPYIVMGYAGEETLRSRLREGRLSEREALDIFVQVCRGVQALHERGLVHFDLKPANVFLRGDFARVGDYGLSKLVGRSAMSLSFGRGTPYFMAPELLRRRGDHRSDIYSLGVILFECLTGRVPFQGDTEWEVLKKHETQRLSFPPDLPSRFRPILEGMLAKRPEDRYQHVGEVLADLALAQSPPPPPIADQLVPVATAPVGSARTGPGWIAALVIFLVFAGGTFAWVYHSRAKGAWTHYRAYYRSSDSESYVAPTKSRPWRSSGRSQSWARNQPREAIWTRSGRRDRDRLYETVRRMHRAAEQQIHQIEMEIRRLERSIERTIERYRDGGDSQARRACRGQ